MEDLYYSKLNENHACVEQSPTEATGIVSLSKNSLPLKEPASLLPCSQELGIGLFPMPGELDLHLPTLCSSEVF